MLPEGADAPTFTLPGVVEGGFREIDLADHVGDGIVVLAFYPADFNPACGEEDCDLTELDLLAMGRDVEVFAVSPDSVFSHRRFAETYSLSIPLLSDGYGEATDAYDVRREGDQLLAERAVFVVDLQGTVRYAWSTDDLHERPDADAVRAAVASVGGDSTALGRYRIGHAHYMEGRRAFTGAMDGFADGDWLLARGDFDRAAAEFEEATDQFRGAVRFAESDRLETRFERAAEKATALWQAAEWLADAASAYATGEGREGHGHREDAEGPLETARDIEEPQPPDALSIAPADGSADAARQDTSSAGDEPRDASNDVDAAVEAVETDARPDPEDIDLSEPD